MRKFLSVPISIWLLAALPRLLVYFWTWHHPGFFIHGDSADYLNLAREIGFHHRYYYPGPPATPAFVFTPGYAFFLAPFIRMSSSPLLVVSFVQTCLGILGTVIIWKWLALMADGRAAWWGTSFFALDWVVLAHTPSILADLLMLFFLTLALYKFWETPLSKSLDVGLLGFLWGVPAMIKPIALYLPVLFSAVYRNYKRSLIFFLVGLSFLPSAWMVRNYYLSKTCVFSSMGGLHLLEYMAGGVESLRLRKPAGVIGKELIAQCDAEHPGSSGNEIEQSKVYGQCAEPILLAHPGFLILFNMIGALKIIAGTGTEMFWEWISQTSTTAALNTTGLTGGGTRMLLRNHPSLLLFQLFYWLDLAVLYTLYLRGLWRLKESHRGAEAALLAIGVFYFLILSSHTGYYRYRLPMMPFLVAGAAVALSREDVKPPFISVSPSSDI